MDRREFLITSGGAAVAVTSAVAAEAASPPAAQDAHPDATVLRLSMGWTDAPQGPADSARRLARRIQDMTGGRYRFEISADPSATDESDLVHGTAHDFAGSHPAFAYFGGLPGSTGLAAQDFAHWIAVGGGQMLWDDLAGQHGWKPLLAGHLGEAPPLWSREAITGLRDLAGQRVVAQGLGAEVARALGAEGVPVTADATAALQDGTAIAVEAGLLTGLASGLARATRHATGNGLNARGTAVSLNVRLSVWDRLSEADRAIFAAAAAEEFQLSLAEARAHEHVARRALSSGFGVTFAAWPTEISEAIDRVAEAIVAHVAGCDAIAARIDQSYIAFRNALDGEAAARRTSAPLA